MLLLGVGKTNGDKELSAHAIVPKALEGTLSAQQWVIKALACGDFLGTKWVGRMHNPAYTGKPGFAQGATSEPRKAAEAEAAAKAYAAERLSVEIS